MNMNPYNFLYFVKQLVTGGAPTTPIAAADGGFLKDVDLSGHSGTPAGSTLSSTALTFGPFMVPRDFDETYDTLQLRLLGSTDTAGDVTVVTSLVSAAVPGSSTTVTLGTTSTVVNFADALNYAAITLDASKLGLTRDTVFSVSTVIPGVSNQIDVVSGHLSYASDLVAYDMYGNDIVNGKQQAVRG